MLRGLKDLEDHQIIHRDIKPSNILVRPSKTPEGEGFQEVDLTIVDFGFSADLEHHKHARHAGCGTIGYMAPEIILTKGQNPESVILSSKIDVFSAGIIFYEM